MARSANIVVSIARAWIGTPYVHQASVKGAGCDCLGLLRGVWRELHGEEPEAIAALFAGLGRSHRRGDIAQRACAPSARDRARALAPGDVALFRMSPRGPAKHCGIVASERRQAHPHPRPPEQARQRGTVHALSGAANSHTHSGSDHGFSRPRHRRLGAWRVAVRQRVLAVRRRHHRRADRRRAGRLRRQRDRRRHRAGPHVKRTGSRLSDINITASTEGAAVPRLYGRMRVARPAHLGQPTSRKPRPPPATSGGKGWRQGHRHRKPITPIRSPSRSGLCEGEITASAGSGPTAC